MSKHGAGMEWMGKSCFVTSAYFTICWPYKGYAMALDAGCDMSHQRKAVDFLYEHTQTLEEQLHSYHAMYEQH